MAIVLIVVVLVLLLGRALPELARLRDFSWLHAWRAQVRQTDNAALQLLLVVGVPVLLCALVQLALRGVLFGFAGFAFALLLLFYCWGARDLERDVEAIEKAPDSE